MTLWKPRSWYTPENDDPVPRALGAAGWDELVTVLVFFLVELIKLTALPRLWFWFPQAPR